jgi:NADPH:quinone reductase-like Zn-dependent oxidoreductase
MLALRYHQFGGPDVMGVEDAPEPHAGPGQVRVTVRAASVNPFDWKLRAGYMADVVPTTFPVIPGTDAAGVVDEVGAGVDGVAVGDEVFGLGSATSAEFAVLDLVGPSPTPCRSSRLPRRGWPSRPRRERWTGSFCAKATRYSLTARPAE